MQIASLLLVWHTVNMWKLGSFGGFSMHILNRIDIALLMCLAVTSVTHGMIGPWYPNRELPLHDAAFCGECDRVSCLLDAGTNINEPDSNGRTALHYAASACREWMINQLLAHDADAGLQDKYKNTALHALCLSSLHHSSSSFEHGDAVRALRALVAHDASVSDEEDGGYTPLACVVMASKCPAAEGRIVVDQKKRYRDMAECLIECGAELSPERRSTLYCACDYPVDVEMVALLLRHGANVNGTVNGFQGAPLHAAVRSGSAAVVRLLLNGGAFIDVQDVSGRSPLHDVGSLALMELLLGRDADMEVADRRGVTPLAAYANGAASYPATAPIERPSRTKLRVLLAYGASMDPETTLCPDWFGRGQ